MQPDNVLRNVNESVPTLNTVRLLNSAAHGTVVLLRDSQQDEIEEELVEKTAEMRRTAPTVDLGVDLGQEIECECMVCDLPMGEKHEPVNWRVRLHFPGPYPYPGDSVMLLCDHCRDDWVDGDWDAPYNNFHVVSCIRV